MINIEFLKKNNLRFQELYLKKEDLTTKTRFTIEFLVLSGLSLFFSTSYILLLKYIHSIQHISIVGIFILMIFVLFFSIVKDDITLERIKRLKIYNFDMDNLLSLIVYISFILFPMVVQSKFPTIPFFEILLVFCFLYLFKIGKEANRKKNKNKIKKAILKIDQDIESLNIETKNGLRFIFNENCKNIQEHEYIEANLKKANCDFILKLLEELKFDIAEKNGFICYNDYKIFRLENKINKTV